MGLDQYAYKVKYTPSKKVDFQEEIVNIECDHFHYWRKHPNLHGFMEKLYREKGGTDDFNCRPVVLEIEDINRLAESIIDGNLPRTSGFFFGESYGDEDEIQNDLDFCKQAADAIKEGYTVFYDSWW